MIVKNPERVKLNQELKRKNFTTKGVGVNDLIEKIMSEEINYADILAEKLDDDSTLNSWLYGFTNVKIKKYAYDRNENGHMEYKFNEITKRKYTTNGEERLIYLIDMARKYDSAAMSKIVDMAIEIVVNGYNNDDYYYVLKDVNYEKRVMDTNLDNICYAYLQLPKELQNKHTLIKFFEDYQNTDSLKNSGYKAAKRLITDFKNQLSAQDVKVLSNYIYSRLERMENKMFAFNDKKIERSVTDYIQHNEYEMSVENSPISVLQITAMQKKLEELKELSSDSYKSLKAKYNKELSRYFQLIKPISTKHELNRETNHDTFVELFEDLEKTYEIINDEVYGKQASNIDVQISRFEKHIKKCGEHSKRQVLDDYKEYEQNNTLLNGKKSNLSFEVVDKKPSENDKKTYLEKVQKAISRTLDTSGNLIR